MTAPTLPIFSRARGVASTGTSDSYIPKEISLIAPLTHTHTHTKIFRQAKKHTALALRKSRHTCRNSEARKKSRIQTSPSSQTDTRKLKHTVDTSSDIQKHTEKLSSNQQRCLPGPVGICVFSEQSRRGPGAQRRLVISLLQVQEFTTGQLPQGLAVL